MVKFSKGMWEPAQGAIIDWAVETFKSEALEDRIRWVTSTKRINHRGDTLNTPTITFNCSSPVQDVLLLEAYHWKGHVPSNKGPNYELFPNQDLAKLASSRQDDFKTLKTDTELKLTTNSLAVNVDLQPHTFNVDFVSHANPKKPILLTKLGWRSVGHVKLNANSVHPRDSIHPNDMLQNPNRGERWFTFQFQLSVGEKIYGLGERFGPFIKNGQSVEMWNEDGGTSSELTYKNVPFYLSSHGYGVFIPCPGFISYEIQSERTTRVNIAVPFESLSAYIIHGPSPAAIIERYTLITGRPALPPLWTFGLWLTTSFTTSYDEKTVNSFLDGMKERDIPLSVFHYDCFWMKGFQWCDFEFDPEFFPDAPGQLRRLKEKGYHISVWINPYIAQESKLFDEGFENGYFIKKSDGSIWQFDAWQAGMGFVDFTNPDAWKWYQSKLRTLVDMGVDCFKTDFGERIPTGDAIYFDGSNPEKMHNYYSFLYNKCVFETMDESKQVLFARSATAGGQRFPIHWGGDPMSTFEAMAETLRGGLSLGLCGFAFWAHDIGGFEGKPDPALYKRWFAFGAMSSHSRLHGSGSFRVPWLIDESGEADKVLKHFTAFKLSLMPYLYSTAVTSHQTGVPMMRPLFVEFPHDPISWILDTQYLLGPNLLIAPVFNEEGDISYYIPKGKWYGLLDGRVRQGPGYIEENHDFFSLPVLLRPGSAVAMSTKQGLEGPAYDTREDVAIVVNPEEVAELVVTIPQNDTVVSVKVNSNKVQAVVEKGDLKNAVLRVVGDRIKETPFEGGRAAVDL